MIRKMNAFHYKMTGWALEKIKINKNSRVLDIGCGGGRTVKRLSKLAPKGFVCGLDYSPLSVERSIKLNRHKIRKGSVDIVEASVSQMPFVEGVFDIVTSFESFYFFPDVKNNMKEIRRVLKPQGTLLICLEIYKDTPRDEINGAFAQRLNLNYYSADELRNLFEFSGFDNIGVFEEKNEGWVCITGNKMI